MKYYVSKSLLKFVSINFFLFIENSKKSVVQRVKVFKLLNGESSKISNDLNVKIVGNYLQQITNLLVIQTKKFGFRIG